MCKECVQSNAICAYKTQVRNFLCNMNIFLMYKDHNLQCLLNSTFNVIKFQWLIIEFSCSSCFHQQKVVHSIQLLNEF